MFIRRGSILRYTKKRSLNNLIDSDLVNDGLVDSSDAENLFQADS